MTALTAPAATTDAPSRPPKVFLSYSWTSPEYGERVVALAKRLREDGVDVLLDRAHLTGGQDANAYMERAVTDETVTHVLLLCDPLYAEKADGRKGGVGTETLIVSPAVYASATQSRFVPVIFARRDDDTVAVPAYVRGRIYYDLSDPETEEAGYVQLLRHLHNKPDVVLPPLGKRPAYLDDDAPARTTAGTAAAFRAAAVGNRPHRWAALDDYLDKVVEAVEGLRFPPGVANAEALRALALERIDGFVPYRDEYVEMVRVLVRYADEPRAYTALHRFVERLANVVHDRRNESYSDDFASPHLGFLARELLLHTAAVLLAAEQFDGVSAVTSSYYVQAFAGGRGEVRSVEALDTNLRLIDELPGYYPGNAAALLARRATVPPIGPAQIREAEFVCALRARLDAQVLTTDGLWPRLWYPRASHMSGFGVADLPLVLRFQDPRFTRRFAAAVGMTPAEFAANVRALPPLQHGERVLAWSNAESLVRVLHLDRA